MPGCSFATSWLFTEELTAPQIKVGAQNGFDMI